MTEIAHLSAGALLAAIRLGRISCEEAVKVFFGRMDVRDRELNAVVARRTQAALAEARVRDEALARGDPPGPLHGLSMTIKDSIEVAGLPAACGAPALRDHQPAADAPAVARLRAAGAVILGKTNVPLYAADFQTFNEVFGTTRNPYALDRSPGGSSGGAAASLAAGFATAELGSDLAGSLRQPAHACGVAALKPTFGIVPAGGSLSGPVVARRPADLWVLGPMARTVADLRLLLNVLAGPDERLAPGWKLELPPGPAAGAKLRVAAWLDDPFCPPDRAVAPLLAAAVAKLGGAGVDVEEGARPAFGAEEAFLIHCALMYGEMSFGLPDEVYDYFVARAGRGRPAVLPHVTDVQAAGLAARHRDWLRACELREGLRVAWAEFFRDRDALVCPVAPTPAALHDHRRLDQRTQPIDGVEFPALQHAFWTALASTAGLPAATVPVGLDATGLPVGIQVIGAWYRDRTVLEVAERIERACGGFRPPERIDGAFRPTAAPAG